MYFNHVNQCSTEGVAGEDPRCAIIDFQIDTTSVFCDESTVILFNKTMFSVSLRSF